MVDCDGCLLGTTGVHQPAAVEAHAVRGGLPPYHRPGEEEVRTHWMEHPLRVQPGWLYFHCPIYSEPSGWHRPQEGEGFFWGAWDLHDMYISVIVIQRALELENYDLVN